MYDLGADVLEDTRPGKGSALCVVHTLLPSGSGVKALALCRNRSGRPTLELVISPPEVSWSLSFCLLKALLG